MQPHLSEDEVLDIVDDNDKVIGKDTRDNIWKRHLEHNVRVVNIFIVNSQGKVLVPKRSMAKKIYPGCYDFSCGEHVFSGESYEEAARRGLLEELGITDAKLELLGKLTPADGARCFATIFKVNLEGDIKKFNKSEIDEIYWLSLGEIREMLEKDEKRFKGTYKETLEKFF